MNVYLADNGRDLIPGDMIVRWVARSDLVPVPRTLEMTVRVKDGIEKRLLEGAFLWTGREGLKYQIVKVQRNSGSGAIQGKDPLAVMNVTAMLAACVKVSYRLGRAVIRENGKIGEIFRACGADISVATDIPVRWFAAYAGMVPSFALAQVMQEEGAAVVIREKRLSILRLADLFKQEPKERVGQSDTTDLTESEFLSRQIIPGFFSLNDSGDFVFGDMSQPRAFMYQPRSDERVLRNMTGVLVTKRKMTADMRQDIQGGDIIEVASKRMVVVTAAHVFENDDSTTAGITNSNSTFWLGELSK